MKSFPLISVRTFILAYPVLAVISLLINGFSLRSGRGCNKSNVYIIWTLMAFSGQTQRMHIDRYCYIF